MLENLKQSWRDFVQAPSGKRFQQRFEKQQRSQQTIWRKALLIGGGMLVMAIGLFFIIAPGPGLLVIFIGAGLIAQQSLLAARALDWSELQSRKLADWASGVWRHVPLTVKIVLMLFAMFVTGAASYAAYTFLFTR
jgi:uncharacterized protein (TIGR02611 family)